jgi:radical SAM superfamily enzyme YgiQ (UPF0313 family)
MKDTSRNLNPDLLLAICPPWDVSQPPIGPGYLVAAVRRAGFEAEFHDLNVEVFNAVARTESARYWDVNAQNALTAEGLAKDLLATAPEILDSFVERVVDSKAQVVGFSVHYWNLALTERLVARIRDAAPDRMILYGGPQTTTAYFSRNLGDLSADGYVLGEGEKTLVEALALVRKTGALVDLPGLVVNAASEFSPRKPILDLDALPFPDYEPAALSLYTPDEASPSLPFLFSRGCTGSCAFCTDKLIFGKYRTRSAENAIAEIESAIAAHGIRRFRFNDLICNGSLKSLETFCDELIARDLNVRWSSYAVVRKGLTPGLFAKMRRAGCDGLVFGLESGSSRVLELMGKHYDAPTAEQAIRDSARAGIRTMVNIIVGFPGETEVEFNETLDFIRSNRGYIDDVVNLSALMLFPGTPIANEPERFGVRFDGDPSRWITEGGNTPEERALRLQLVRKTLDELNIATAIVYEAGVVQPSPAGQTEPSSAPGDAGLTMTTDATGINPGDPLTVTLDLETVTPIANALLRVQIFNNEPPHTADIFVFGTNTSRAGVPVEFSEPGKYRATLSFDNMDLRPRNYRLVAGLWSGEGAQTPVGQAETKIAVKGEPDPLGATVDVRGIWTVLENAAEATDNRLGELTLLSAPHASGLPFTAELDAELAEPERFYLVAQALKKDCVTFRAVSEIVLPKGRLRIAFAVESLPLLSGRYLLELFLIERETGNAVSTRWAPFEVKSANELGDGLAHLPTCWRIERLR